MPNRKELTGVLTDYPNPFDTSGGMGRWDAEAGRGRWSTGKPCAPAPAAARVVITERRRHA